MSQHPDFRLLPNSSAERLGFPIPTRSSSLRSHQHKQARSLVGRSASVQHSRHVSDGRAALHATRDQVSRCLRTLSLSNRATGEIEVGQPKTQGKTLAIEQGMDRQFAGFDGVSSHLDTSRNDEDEHETEESRTDADDYDKGEPDMSYTALDKRPRPQFTKRVESLPYPRPMQRQQPISQPLAPLAQIDLKRALSASKQASKKAGLNIKTFWETARIGHRPSPSLDRIDRNHPSRRMAAMRNSGETLVNSAPASPAFAWHLLDPKYQAMAEADRYQSERTGETTVGAMGALDMAVNGYLQPPNETPLRTMFPHPSSPATSSSQSGNQNSSDPPPGAHTSSSSPPTSPKSFSILRFPDPPENRAMALGLARGEQTYIAESSESSEEDNGDSTAYLKLNVIQEGSETGGEGEDTSPDGSEEKESEPVPVNPYDDSPILKPIHPSPRRPPRQRPPRTKSKPKSIPNPKSKPLPPAPAPAPAPDPVRVKISHALLSATTSPCASPALGPSLPSTSTRSSTPTVAVVGADDPTSSTTTTTASPTTTPATDSSAPASSQSSVSRKNSTHLHAQAGTQRAPSVRRMRYSPVLEAVDQIRHVSRGRVKSIEVKGKGKAKAKERESERESEIEREEEEREMVGVVGKRKGKGKGKEKEKEKVVEVERKREGDREKVQEEKQKQKEKEKAPERWPRGGGMGWE